MTDAITEAMERAKAVPTPDPTPSTSQAQTPAVYGGAAAPAKPRSLADAMNAAGAVVDGWLSTKGQEGFKLGKKKIDKQSIKVTINVSEVKFGYGVRFNNGSGTTYLKSYDGVSEAQSGKHWATEVAKAQQLDDKCKGQYDLADIPMTLLETITTVGKEPITLEAGKRVGHTTPITGYLPFMNWVNKVVPKHGPDTEIQAEVFLQEKTGGGQVYDIIAIREPSA